MRNLKKILALVLALVMTMSLVTVASAAEEVSPNYAEAVAVLQDMGVFKGYADGSFGGQKDITREEVATILYRIISKDVDDSHKGLYVEACNFEDVNDDRWSAGFIGYCANGGYVKGYNAKSFGPADKVTGYQVLAMILRAIGYDKNGEFTGSEWTKNVAATAQQLGILQNVSKDVVLSQPASRELVAELIFRTIATVPQVTYTPAFGYQPILNNVNKADVTLGLENFELIEGAWETKDEFGRPGYSWTYNVYPYETVLMDTPYKTFTTAATECDISIARGNTGTWAASIWVNGTPVGGEGTETLFYIQANDQVAKLGAQGRIMEVYRDRLVMIDTFLAKVEATTPVIKDTAGHRIQNAIMTLTVYDGINETTTINVSRSWDWEYTVGSYVLVNGLTDSTDQVVNGLYVETTGVYDDVEYIGYWHVLGLADSFIGKQSALHYNIEKHTIDGVTYDDANAYELDAAGNTINNFNWFKDQFGNIIGSTLIPTAYEYGVINNLQWVTQIGNVGYAQANITLIDGTTKSIVVSKLFDEDDTAADVTTLTRAFNNIGDVATKGVSTEFIQNNVYVGTDLYRIADNGNGTFTLVDVANPIVTNGAEATGVTVRKGNAVMLTGGVPVVDSNTKFLYGYNVGNVLAFATVTYTGFNTIAALNNATVDYVDLNGDNRVDLAYVYGTPVSSLPYASMFYMTSNSYVQQLFDENGLVNAYILTGYVNGVEGSIKIANDAAGTALVADILNAWNTNDKNVLLQVDVVGGYVVSQQAVTTTAAPLSTVYGYGDVYGWSGYYGYLYAPEAVRYAGTTTTATYNGDVLIMSDGTVYDVTETTQIFGELQIGKAYGSNYVIHVVYDAYFADNDALEIYVFAKPLVGGGTTGTTTTGFTGIDATLVPGGVLTVTNYAAGLPTAVAANANYTVTYYVNGVQQTTVTGIIVAGNASSVITLPGANTGTVIAVITCGSYTATVVL